jgi:hypothetical protein
MTRNNLDDLFIAEYLITNYILFILNRIEQQNDILNKEFLLLKDLTLSDDCYGYICEQEKYHFTSTQEYENVLKEIKKKISDFYQENQKPFPLYAKETYRKNADEHRKALINLISELFKN